MPRSILLRRPHPAHPAKCTGGSAPEMWLDLLLLRLFPSVGPCRSYPSKPDCTITSGSPTVLEPGTIASALNTVSFDLRLVAP